MFICRICGHSGEAEIFKVREMMFGSQELFDYIQCSACGCLQIAEIPKDVGKYYGGGYYSLSPAQLPARGGLSNILDKIQIQARIKRLGILGDVVNGIIREPDIATWIKYSKCGVNSRILDIGCGNGRLLLRLWSLGFKNLEGIDPYLDGDIDYGNGVVVRKRDIHAVTDNYDLVMMHHSLEHVRDPVSTLTAAAAVMNPGACLLIRVPLVDSEAWDIYRENWVQLDAPRHLHLLTRKAVDILASRCGLAVKAVVNDSHAMQFWGSEQYVRGISLRDQKSIMVNSEANTFSKSEITVFAKRSNVLNKLDRGDQACFFLALKDSSSFSSKQ